MSTDPVLRQETAFLMAITYQKQHERNRNLLPLGSTTENIRTSSFPPNQRLVLHEAARVAVVL
jgi:hypothetical protein